MVVIHSAKFAVLLRVIQIILLGYSVVYLLIYDKGYQKSTTTVIACTTVKVKGIGYLKEPEDKYIIIDGADYIIPPTENNAIFIMSNFIETEQTRSVCSELETNSDAKCESDKDCAGTAITMNPSGYWTGRCLLPSQPNNTTRMINALIPVKGLCEYSGWCPAESDSSPSNLIQGILNFTVFIKNFIEFPVFDVKLKNMVANLQVCLYDPEKNPDCPIFTIDYILNEAEANVTERNLMLRYGGVIRIKVEWDCDLDHGSKLCKPKYSFARLDAPFSERPFSMGFNFRYASSWKPKGNESRKLTKAYGLRFILSISGKAGKFDFITLSLNIGSLVGIFGLGTYICDLVLLHLSRNASTYRNFVFDVVHLRTRLNSTHPNADHLKPVRDSNYSQHELNYAMEISNGLADSHPSILQEHPITSFKAPTNDE